LVEEADCGYSGGSGLDALCCICVGYASQRVDGNGGGGLAGFVEAAQALAREDGFGVDIFFEDRGEKNRVWLVRFRCRNAGDSVTGDGNKYGKRG
jgi:hypothetical protein